MSIRFREDPLPMVNYGERHVICVILVDISGSTAGRPNEELNQGLVEFGQALQEDPLALGRAEVVIISFNSNVTEEMSMRPAAEYQAPSLSAGGMTSLNEAICAGLDAIEARKKEYKASGIQYYRPWLFLMTDGAATDQGLEGKAKERLKSAIRNKKVVYMPLGIGEADRAKLQEYYPDETPDNKRVVLKAEANSFKESFVWLSESISVVSHSNPLTESEVSLPVLPQNITVGI